MSEEIEVSGEELLELLKAQVEESYKCKVASMALEQNDITKKISGIFILEDRIGYVKLETELTA